MSSVPSLERAIAILRLLNRSRRTIAAPDVCVELGIPRSTTHRLLQALVKLDLLKREPGDAYSSAHGVLSLGFAHLSSQSVVEIADPILANLRDETHCTAHLGIRDRENTIYLLKHLAPSPFAPTIEVGSSVPCYATVLGRVLLLDAKPAVVRKLFKKNELERLTEGTPATVDELIALLQVDRRRGFASSKGFYGNVAAVAAPVRSAHREIVAGVSLVAPLGSRVSERINSEIKDKLLTAVTKISRALGAH